jgi:3-methyladenine DNA glycosylase AlkC
MAEPLKTQFGAGIPARIAAMIAQAWPAFDQEAFLKDALDGYASLELIPRGRWIAQALHRYLPQDYEVALAVLMDSIGQKLDGTQDFGMASFFYLPHTCFVAAYGLDHFEISMHAQYELTQRFTAEFSIRPFLERHPQATLSRLKDWANDPSPHVRRLVSEGTRPRLPWAPRLRAFQLDPQPVLALLELLKDDPELYVRRSVANSLNDIGKDHPLLLVETAQRWLVDALGERRWLVQHALRSAVKRGEAGALGVLGFGDSAMVSVSGARITPERVVMGGAVTIAFDVCNTESRTQQALVDLRIHFVKLNGKSSSKVFKLKVLALLPQSCVRLSKTISLTEMTTRKHYPGVHQVDVVINGLPQMLGEFDLS